MAEIPLGGGNVSGGVVRIGDTARRPTGPGTAAVYALLRPPPDARWQALIPAEGTGVIATTT